MVLLEIEFGYVLGEILPTMQFTELSSFKKKGGGGKIYMVTHIKISIKLGLINKYKVCFGD